MILRYLIIKGWTVGQICKIQPYFYRVVVFLSLFFLQLSADDRGSSLIHSQVQVVVEGFPRAHNPSLIRTKEGLLLVFRNIPDKHKPWISQIGVLFLNEQLEPISKPALLDTRINGEWVPSQSEDARIFEKNGQLFLMYNDNTEITNPGGHQHRDMHLATVEFIKDCYVITSTQLLYHEDYYAKVNWQKNWVPFAWQDHILFSYSINPHEVIYPDEETGKCVKVCMTKAPVEWKRGAIRGGTPALLLDGEYFAFFHSAQRSYSNVSSDEIVWHYVMGAYTFSAEPPFELTAMTPYPIVVPGFYEEIDYEKRVIFPGGFVVEDSYIHLAYGKDDKEIWIVTFDKAKLKALLKPIVQDAPQDSP